MAAKLKKSTSSNPEAVHLTQNIVSEMSGRNLTARSQAEASRVEAALRFNGGNVTSTAKHLGVPRATLYRKLQFQDMHQEGKKRWIGRVINHWKFKVLF